MSFIAFVLVVLAAFVFWKFVLKKQPEEIAFSVPHTFYTTVVMRFSLKTWRLHESQGIDDFWSTNIHEVRRVGPMQWQWRLVNYSEKRSYPKTIEHHGLQHVIEGRAFMELLENKEAKAKLSNRRVDAYVIWSLDNLPQYEQLKEIGLAETFDALVAKHRKLLEIWKDMPHEMIVQLEPFFIKNEPTARS